MIFVRSTIMLDYDYTSETQANPMPTKLTKLGNLQSLTLPMEVNGVGEFINDFLDVLVLFASTSASQTLPDNGNLTGMGVISLPLLTKECLALNGKNGLLFMVRRNCARFYRQRSLWFII
ncbi:MAG: hypothetical protein KAH18_08740 [Psychromonas sp.]|nr:hypothetical protein [Psychromonas sp.]